MKRTDIGKIASYKGAVRCRILDVKESLFTLKIRKVLVNFGSGVPAMWVEPCDLCIIPGETHINPNRA